MQQAYAICSKGEVSLCVENDSFESYFMPPLGYFNVRQMSLVFRSLTIQRTSNFSFSIVPLSLVSDVTKTVLND